MKASQNCIALIKRFEGLMTKSYICPSGKVTIGYGHTQGVKEGDVITLEGAEKLLKQDVSYFEGALDRELQRYNIEVNQNQFDALVSFAFNLGVNALLKSNLWHKLRAGSYTSAADEFLKWNKGRVNGQLVELKGLTRRRQAERELFLS